MDVISIRLGKIFNNIKTKISVIFNYAKSEEKYLPTRQKIITARLWAGRVIRKIFLKAASASPRCAGLFLAAVLAVVAAGLIFPSGNVYAGSIGESLGGFVLDLIAPIIYLVFYVFLYIAYAIAWIGADVINITLDPSVMNSILNITPGSSLYQAWAIFRDIANLLFILILLLVAFGTIFRSDTYNAKKSLPSLIIVAFLINFSAMITGVVIDFTNILMFGIFKMMCAGSSSSCSQDFFNALMKTAGALFDKYSILGVFSFDFKDAAAIAISAIYVFIYGLVLMALGVFFLIRIAAFAILIVLSPLAFFGQVAPGLKGISNKWWDNLLQYAFFGPIAALLLYVSGLMAQNTIAVPTAIFEVDSKMSWLQQDISLIVTNIIPLIFLLAIIPITRSMGIAMSGAVFSGVAMATFGGMATVGRAWGQGKLFPGQQHITNAGNKIGGWALKKSPWLKGKWSGVPGRVGYRYTGVNTPGLKGHLKNAKDKLKSSARGVGVRGYTVGGTYDWVAKQRKNAEIAIFKKEKTLGQYAEMGMRGMNPMLLHKKYKDWLQKADYENYKIPLGSSPDERRGIEMKEAYKAVNDLKSAGGFDNPEIVSDKAAEEFEKGNNMTFEILTKLLATQDKQFKVLASINRKSGTSYSEDAEGWAQFLNDYKGKVGVNQASNFGQEVGISAAKESNWSAGNIAYYDKGVNKIRDIGTVASRNPAIITPEARAQRAEYNEYVKNQAEAMGKKSIGSKWNNMSSDNFARKLAGPANVGFSALIKGVSTPINISVNHEANEQGIAYINGHMTIEEIERNVGKGKPEEMKKIRDGIAYTIDNNAGVFTNRAKAEQLRDRLTQVMGK